MNIEWHLEAGSRLQVPLSPKPGQGTPQMDQADVESSFSSPIRLLDGCVLRVLDPLPPDCRILCPGTDAGAIITSVRTLHHLAFSGEGGS